MLSFITLTLISSLVSGQSSSSLGPCISLQASTQCNEYKSYSIMASPSFSNAAEFDNYVVAQTTFAFACPNLRTTPIKYSKTFTCGYAVYFSTFLAPADKRCNQAATPPTPICQASAQSALADVQANLQRSCPSVNILPSYTSFANSINDTNCLLGVGTDVNLKCGFTSTNDANAYCRTNSNAVCCTASSNIIAGPVGISSPITTESSTDSADAAVTTDLSALPTDSSTSTDDSFSASSSATASSSNSSTGSLAVSPLLIGAAALGLALVAVLASVLYFMTKKKTLPNEPEFVSEKGDRKSIMNAGMTSSGMEEIMECVFDYKANLFDELSLDVGDEVKVVQKFDDGWALGHNLTTGKEGTFPLACLAPLGTGSEYRDSRFESRYSKRDSSIRYTVDSSAFSRPY